MVLRVALLLGLNGCSLIFDIDDLSRDAAMDSVVDTTMDGPGDASTMDVRDASSSEGGACGATIFDDFDQGALGAKWSSMSANGIQIGLDTTSVVSPPSSLKIDIPTSGGTGGLVKMFPKTKHVCCVFSVRVDGTLDAWHSRIGGMNGSFALRLSTGMQSTLRESFAGPDGGFIGPDSPVALPADGKWHLVTLDAVLGTPPTVGELRMDVDGMTTLKRPFGDATFDVTMDNVLAGVTYGPASASPGTRTIRFDDFGCSAIP